MELEARVRRFVAASKPCIDGEGGCHNRLLAMAISLTRGFDLADSVALSVLVDEYNPKCAPPWTQRELEHKVAAARAKAIDQANGYLIGNGGKHSGSKSFGSGSKVAPPAEVKKPVFVPESLRKVSGHLLGMVKREWLGDRSPIAPHGVSAEEFLRLILAPGETVVVVEDNYKSKGSYIVTRPEAMEGVKIWGCANHYDRETKNWKLEKTSLYSKFPTRSCANGFWWLPQPANGKPTLNSGGKWSWRSEANVLDWRWLVLESDVEGFERHWVALLSELPVPIGAIYSSGKRSVHALLRVDAQSKEQWDGMKAEMAPTFVELGADPAALSAVRLTRLPQMWRGRGLQALHFLDPACDDTPIVDRDVLRSVREEVRGSAKLEGFYRL